MRFLLCLSLCIAVWVPARAQRAAVLTGDHPSYGRLVIELEGPAAPTIVQHGNRVEVGLPDPVEIATPDRVPRNVISFQGGAAAATMTMVPGARFKQTLSGKLIILDVFDPKSRRPGPAGATTARVNPASQATSVASLPLPPLPPETRPNLQAASDALPSEPATRKPSAEAEETRPAIASASSTSSKDAVPSVQTLPPLKEESAQANPEPLARSAAVADTPTTTSPKTSPRAELQVVAGATVGAAAFRRGSLGVIVFDDMVDVDNPDDGPIPDDVAVSKRQGATVVTIPLGPDETIALSHQGDVWSIATAPVSGSAALQARVPTGIALQFEHPGRTLTISDPVTGQLLLVGTVRQASNVNTRLTERREAPGYALLPTWLGLAAEVTSDMVDLRVSAAGFLIQVPDANAPQSASADVAHNPFDLPIGETATLRRQLDAQIVSAAVAPPRERGRERLAAARTMLALGMAPEAQALIALAANADASVSETPQTAMLQGIAAVLAGRPEGASSLDSPDLPASKAAALWRGLRDVELGRSAPMLASTWSSLDAYPAAIKDRISPQVIEAALDGGEVLPSTALMGRRLAFARARSLQRNGDAEKALKAYDEIINGPDEKQSVRAALAATDLRLSMQQITPEFALENTERQIARWRGDVMELTMRLRVADLRRQVGKWRGALDMLAETGRLFPSSKERVAEATASVFRQLLAAEDKTVPALELVAIVGDYVDRLPTGSDGDRLAALLCKKFAALDLPSRAIPILERLSQLSQSPKVRADLAMRLGPLQLEVGQVHAAIETLSGIDPDLLTAGEQVQRLTLWARARAADGDLPGAAAIAAQLDTDAGKELQAEFYAKAGRWQESLNALTRLAAEVIPSSGDLTSKQQDLLLRAATAAVHANDQGALNQLRASASRMKGSQSDLFKVLTATAIEGPRDLSRARQELAMTRSVAEHFPTRTSR